MINIAIIKIKNKIYYYIEHNIFYFIVIYY